MSVQATLKAIVTSLRGKVDQERAITVEVHEGKRGGGASAAAAMEMVS
jgi:hypothetical protein